MIGMGASMSRERAEGGLGFSLDCILVGDVIHLDLRALYGVKLSVILGLTVTFVRRLGVNTGR